MTSKLGINSTVGMVFAIALFVFGLNALLVILK